MNYVARMYKKDDKTQIFQLIGDVWDKDKAESTKRRWNWEFDDNPYNFSEGPKIFILEADNKIIGMHCAFPVLLKVKDRIVTALWFVDYMVHPKHRGRGFLLLAKAVMKEPLTKLSMPNANSYSIGKKYKWFDIYSILTLVNIINYKKVLKKKIKNSIVALLGAIFLKIISTSILVFINSSRSNNLTLEKVDSFTDEIDEFWKEVSCDYEVIVVRDKKYLTWRFIDCPDKEYTIYVARRNGKISGYIVFRDNEMEGLRFGHIVDILAKGNDGETLKCLIQKARDSLRAKRVDLITCLISPYNGTYKNALRKSGFLFKKYNYRIIGCNNFSPALEEELKNPQYWFITKADSDLDMLA